ncbi:hypothetical protein JGC56_17590 [Salmonella enterica subsp. enterica serovar Saintpaul]|nr:hypothetical protein [Salmonella enterica subsp. enterica serovar Saintpaul]
MIKSMHYDSPAIIVSLIDPENGARNNSTIISLFFSLGEKLYIATSIENKTCDNIIAGSDVIPVAKDSLPADTIVPDSKSTQGLEQCENLKGTTW